MKNRPKHEKKGKTQNRETSEKGKESREKQREEEIVPNSESWALRES